MYFDIIIRNGSIIDGTGRDAYKADIAILGDKIVDIGVIKGASKKEINAKNLIITPGFIDIHTHYDGQAV
jgi:N-acyl-D-aspartate/D-glutamate deacylase